MVREKFAGHNYELHVFRIPCPWVSSAELDYLSFFFKSHFDREKSDALCPYEHPQCWSIQNNQKDVPISLRGASRLDVPFSLSRNPPYGCIQTSEPAIAVFILDPDLMGLCVLLPRSGSRINTAFPAEVHSNMHEFHGFCSTNLLHF